MEDLLVVHHNSKHIMDRINRFIAVKPDSVGPPDINRGVKLNKKTFKDGPSAWEHKLAKYVQQAI